MSDAEGVVRAFVDAFNAEDLDALAATLTDDVEIQSARGLVTGRDEVKEWATRKPSGALHQNLILDRIEANDAHALATVRKQWIWRHPDEHPGKVADEQQFFIVATIRDGLICRWQPFEHRSDATRAAGIDP